MINFSEQEKEQLRLTIAIAIAGTVIAIHAFLPGGYWSFVNGMFIISGILAFVYIILTGASVKYKHTNTLGFVEFPEVFRRISYDVAIDSYDSNVATFSIYIIAYLFQKHKPANVTQIEPRMYLAGILASFLIILGLSYLSRRLKVNKDGGYGR